MGADTEGFRDAVERKTKATFRSRHRTRHVIINAQTSLDTGTGSQGKKMDSYRGAVRKTIATKSRLLLFFFLFSFCFLNFF